MSLTDLVRNSIGVSICVKKNCTVARLIPTIVMFSVVSVAGISVSLAQPCKPRIYLIKGALEGNDPNNGRISGVYSLVKTPYRHSGVSVLRFPAGAWSKDEELVRSVAKTARKNSHDPIVLVGHSWGGESAYWLTGLFADFAHPGTRLILVTLDPVSFNHSSIHPNPIEKIFQIIDRTSDLERIPHPRNRLLHVLRHKRNGELTSVSEANNRMVWLHVYGTNKSGCGDGIAEFGGRWGSRGAPDKKLNANNTELWPGWFKSRGENIAHCDVIPMYYIVQDFIIDEIDRTCGLKIPKAELEIKDGMASLSFSGARTTVTSNDGGQYHGEMRSGKSHGHGIYTWSSGDRYEGDFVDGRRTGRGVYTWSSGDRYEGDFVDGRRTGRGVYTWPSGNRYEGDSVDGRQTGRGVYTWSSGDRYEGDFVDGRRTGRGVYTWPSGNRYEGDFVDGRRTGRGVYTWSSGNRYEGDFVDGRQTGRGVYTWGKGQWEGDRYEGGFVNGRRTGRGRYAYGDGSVIEGEWRDGELVAATESYYSP